MTDMTEKTGNDYLAVEQPDGTYHRSNIVRQGTVEPGWNTALPEGTVTYVTSYSPDSVPEGADAASKAKLRPPSYLGTHINEGPSIDPITLSIHGRLNGEEFCADRAVVLHITSMLNSISAEFAPVDLQPDVDQSDVKAGIRRDWAEYLVDNLLRRRPFERINTLRSPEGGDNLYPSTEREGILQKDTDELFAFAEYVFAELGPWPYY